MKSKALIGCFSILFLVFPNLTLAAGQGRRDLKKQISFQDSRQNAAESAIGPDKLEFNSKPKDYADIGPKGLFGMAYRDGSSANALRNSENTARDSQTELGLRGLLLNDRELIRYLNDIAQKLWAHARTSLPPVRILLVKHPEPDAFIHPNGVCYLNTGLLVRLENEDQLAMAIAHEMMHYLRQHTLEAYYATQPGPPPCPEKNASATDKSRSNRAYPWTGMLRRAELQADREGLKLVASAGYRTAESLRLLKLLKSALLEESGPDKSVVSIIIIMNKRIEQLKKTIRHVPPAPAEHQSKMTRKKFNATIAPAMLANAQAASLTGDWEVAEQNIDTYLEIRPDSARAYCLRGEIFCKKFAKGPHDQALASFRKAIALNHKYAPAYRAMGLLLFKSDNTKAARPYLQTYITLETDPSEKEYIKNYLLQCAP